MTNQSKIVLAAGTVISASRNEDVDIPFGRGVRVTLVTTAEAGTSTLDMKVQTFDAASGTYTDLAGASTAQMTATGTAVLTIYPGIAETANVSVSDAIARRIRIVLTLGGTSFTGSLGVDILI